MSDPDPNKLMEKVEKVSIACVLIGVVMGFTNLIEVSLLHILTVTVSRLA